MDPPSQDSGHDIRPRPPTMRRDLASALREINAQCLQLLVAMAHRPGDSSHDFIDEISGTLCRLSPGAQAAASYFPFLLVDMRFRDHEWWREVTAHPTTTRRSPTWLVQLPRQATIKLARTTLVLAWHTARTDRESAIVLLGISPSVADLLAQLSLCEFDRIAERHFRHLRPRWEDRPAVWAQLLNSAQNGDNDAARELILRGLHLMAGEFLPQCESVRTRHRQYVRSNKLGARLAPTSQGARVKLPFA